nr:MAG TPA: hypothetical protein [Inoviridae sp.]
MTATLCQDMRKCAKIVVILHSFQPLRNSAKYGIMPQNKEI